MTTKVAMVYIFMSIPLEFPIFVPLNSIIGQIHGHTFWEGDDLLD